MMKTMLKRRCVWSLARQRQRRLQSCAPDMNGDWSLELRSPEQLYPRARLRRRKIVYHGGPTNSGKTYWALEALKKAESGVYAGPLRLLAVEVYERLNSDGIYCSLFTGQERREVPFASHASCTIEMVPISRSFDVAVVDEIQLIGSADRGNAWTRALLGLDAREVHVCGSTEAVEVIADICKKTGDELHIQEYKRLTPLAVEKQPLESFAQVKEGDCVVTFSRKDIHAVKKKIESIRPELRCGVVYGQLPPETRSRQARLFNDEGDHAYDILIASDAIGMGLNLNIRRIVFNSTQKFGAITTPPPKHQAEPTTNDDDTTPKKGIAPVDPTLIKQIAGRAGRKSTRFSDDGGTVAAMNQNDLIYVRNALAIPNSSHTRIGIFPPNEMLATFAKSWILNEHDKQTNNNEPYSLADIVMAFVERAAFDQDLYFFAGYQELINVARKLEGALDTLGASRLSIEDMLVFCTAPCNINDRFALHMLASYASMCASGKRTAPNIRLASKPPSSLTQLQDLCTKHNVLDLYLWLNFRYPDTFTEATVAKAQKHRAIELIAIGLQNAELELPDKPIISSKIQKSLHRHADASKHHSKHSTKLHQHNQVSHPSHHTSSAASIVSRISKYVKKRKGKSPPQ